MISTDITRHILRRSTQLNVGPDGQTDSFEPIQTIKKFLLNDENLSEFQYIDLKNFQLSISKTEYNEALFSDYYNSNIRINEQVKNVNNLLNACSQVAWIIVSVYYCNYFVAHELSKISGNYIVNFSYEELEEVATFSNFNELNNFISKVNSNNPYVVEVRDGIGENEVLLNFKKGSKKPHEAVWINMGEIIRSMNVSSELKQHQTNLVNIFNKKNQWVTPSKVRNDWNYKNPSYYSAEGDQLGTLFMENILDKNKAYDWGELRTLDPSVENQCASMAYVYHILLDSNNRILSRLGFQF